MQARLGPLCAANSEVIRSLRVSETQSGGGIALLATIFMIRRMVAVAYCETREEAIAISDAAVIRMNQAGGGEGGVLRRCVNGFAGHKETLLALTADFKDGRARILGNLYGEEIPVVIDTRRTLEQAWVVIRRAWGRSRLIEPDNFLHVGEGLAMHIRNFKFMRVRAREGRYTIVLRFLMRDRWVTWRTETDFERAIDLTTEAARIVNAENGLKPAACLIDGFVTKPQEVNFLTIKVDHVDPVNRYGVMISILDQEEDQQLTRVEDHPTASLLIALCNYQLAKQEASTGADLAAAWAALAVDDDGTEDVGDEDGTVEENTDEGGADDLWAAAAESTEA